MLTLITWCTHIPKISTSSPLQKIPPHACHVAKLRRCAFKQGLGNNWIFGYYLWVFRHIAHLFQRTDAETIRG